jgi:hypothetical protein
MRRRFGLQLVLVCSAAASPAAAADAALPGLKLAPHDSFSALLQESRPDAAQIRWRSTDVPISSRTRLRISLTDAAYRPGASQAQAARAAEAAGAYEVSVVRAWPKAVSFNTGALGVDLSPHAAVGMTPYGGLAEAGARLEVSKRMDDAAVETLNAMGVDDGARFGDRGRWYMFAAASGRAVGMNMLKGDAGWSRAVWSTDQTSTLVGDAQVGVGWRKGAMQTSLGVLHREVKAEHTYFGYTSKPDTLAAFSFAFRPGQ